MNHILMLAAAVILVIYSNVVVKARANFFASGSEQGAVAYLFAMITDPIIWTAILATGTGMVLYLLSLRRIDVSVAQPALAIVFVAVPLSAAYFLGEHLSPLRCAGLGLMAVGVLLVLKSA